MGKDQGYGKEPGLWDGPARRTRHDKSSVARLMSSEYLYFAKGHGSMSLLSWGGELDIWSGFWHCYLPGFFPLLQMRRPCDLMAVVCM